MKYSLGCDFDLSSKCQCFVRIVSYIKETGELFDKGKTKDTSHRLVKKGCKSLY
jgi:hypothetical protein